MSIDATRWAWKQSITTSQKIVLLSMADRAGEDHTCWPSIARLCKDTGLSRPTVFRIFKELEGMGLIARSPVSGKTTVYTLRGVSGREDERPDPSHHETRLTTRPVSQKDPTRLTMRPHPSHHETIPVSPRDPESIRESKRESTIEPVIAQSSADASAHVQEEAVITLPLNTGQEHPVTQSDLAELRELYPAVDIMQELRNMRGWILANPIRRKTRKGIRAFVHNWLRKEQNRGGSMRHAHERPSAPTEYQKRQQEAREMARMALAMRQQERARYDTMLEVS